MFLLSCVPTTNENFTSLFTIKNEGKQLDGSEKYGVYKSRLPISVVSGATQEIPASVLNKLKRIVDDQWNDAEFSSENSFFEFLTKNKQYLDLHQIELRRVSDFSKTLRVESSKNLADDRITPIIARFLKFKIYVRWKLNIDGQQKLYTTPVNGQWIFAILKSKDENDFRAGDVVTYLLNYSSRLAKFKWKSALIHSLSASGFEGDRQYLLLSQSGFQQNIGKQLRNDIFKPVCELYYHEKKELRNIRECKFEKTRVSDFDELDNLSQLENANFVTKLENDLKRISISSCSLSKMQSSKRRSVYDFYLSLPNSKAVDALAQPGRALNLYKRKSSKKASRVVKRVAILDQEVSPRYCGTKNDEIKCVKAIYRLDYRSNNHTKRCRQMVSGKFFLSIKKEKSIVI